MTASMYARWGLFLLSGFALEGLFLLLAVTTNGAHP